LGAWTFLLYGLGTIQNPVSVRGGKLFREKARSYKDFGEKSMEY
jgi:hypothetical protein